jgi:hypothetical protein
MDGTRTSSANQAPRTRRPKAVDKTQDVNIDGQVSGTGKGSQSVKAPVLKAREPWSEKKLNRIAGDSARLAKATLTLAAEVKSLGDVLDKILADMEAAGGLSKKDIATLKSLRDKAKEVVKTSSPYAKALKEFGNTMRSPGLTTSIQALSDADRRKIEAQLEKVRKAFEGTVSTSMPKVTTRTKGQGISASKLAEKKKSIKAAIEELDGIPNAKKLKPGQAEAVKDYKAAAKALSGSDDPTLQTLNNYNDALVALGRIDLYGILGRSVAKYNAFAEAAFSISKATMAINPNCAIGVLDHRRGLTRIMLHALESLSGDWSATKRSTALKTLKTAVDQLGAVKEVKAKAISDYGKALHAVTALIEDHEVSGGLANLNKQLLIACNQ